MLEGKVAVITGGTRGIGLEIVRLFKKNKAEVVLFGSRKETVDKAVKTLKDEGLEVKGYYPNLYNYVELTNVFKKINKEYGHIDILVNNAGVSASKKIEDTTSDEFSNVMNINVNAMFNTTKAVVPFMKSNGGGVIINTSSISGIYGQSSGVSYPASKFAVNGLTKSLARELAPSNIRVNAVAPGVTNTDMIASLPKEMIAPIIASIPLGRIAEPSDIANAFLFLASDMAVYVTGEILSVDGAAQC